jgi:hypothetical protein
VIPAAFTGYFTATAAAAGVLIGLLFVAVSLRPETVFGGSSSAAGRAQAGAAFNSLANCFFVSLVALIPQAGLGVVAIIMSIISLLATVRLHGQAARQELQIVMLALSLVTFGFQLVIGILLVVSPGDHGWVYTAAYLQIALFAVALSRAWGLVQGKHLRPSSQPGTSGPADPATRPSPVHQPDTFQVEIAGTK